MTSNEAVVGGPILTRADHLARLRETNIAVTVAREAVQKTLEARDQAIRAAVESREVKQGEIAELLTIHRNTVWRALDGSDD